jgi:hypothetical protein
MINRKKSLMNPPRGLGIIFDEPTKGLGNYL